jgi:hypothetical protein
LTDVLIELYSLDIKKGVNPGLCVEGGFPTPTSKCNPSLDSVLRAEHFDIILDHFRSEPDHFWPTPDRTPPSLDLRHRAKHFDNSLDHLSQEVLELFNFLKIKKGVIYVDPDLT